MYCAMTLCTQSEGWRRIWRLSIPHKVKIFVWRLCRNNVPVRIRLMHKGVRLPITCPVCNADKEHLLHLFFDCRFAENCWQSVDLKYDMREAYSVSDCLLHESAIAKYEDIVSICLVLWGIWFWRNKKVWQNQWMNQGRTIRGAGVGPGGIFHRPINIYMCG